MIVDYSTSRPSIATLKAAGVTAVGRYLGWDCEPGYGCIGKNISRAEAATLIDAGLSVFLAFEYLADAPARGAAQGHADGQLAWKQLTTIGAPTSMGVYFCCDWDVPDYVPTLPDTPANAVAKLGPVASYFAAINALKYPYEIGVYGGYYAVRRVLDAGLATLAWQTVAWSGGQQDSRAVLLQVTSTPPISGADTDLRQNLATKPDYGQWPRPGTPPPAPNWTDVLVNELTTISNGSSGTDVRSAQGLLFSRGHPVAIDGAFGPATEAAVKALQSASGITVDGVVGPDTWTKLLAR